MTTVKSPASPGSSGASDAQGNDPSGQSPANNAGSQPVDQGAWADTDFTTIRYEFPDCEWRGAINFDPRRGGDFGYLLAWSGPGGLNLKADITVVNPYNGQSQDPGVGAFPGSPEFGDMNQSYFKCVGVIEKFMYKGAQNGPIYISAYISKANASQIAGKFTGVLPSGAVSVCWYIIACDGSGDGWYEAAYIPQCIAANANIDTETDDGKKGVPRISIASKSESLSDDLVDVRLFKFKFQMRPDPTKSNNIGFATASGAKIMRPWGGTQQKDQS